MTKQPIVVELISEPAIGKTHISLLFSNPVILDLTLRGKSKSVLMKLYPDDWEGRYFRIKSFKDWKDALNQAKKDDRKTIVIETGSDLRLMLGAQYLKEVQAKKSSREALAPVEWKQVNEWFKEFVNTAVEDYGMNVVITAEMKDEWKDREKTGRRERDGYIRMDFYADLRLYMKIETETVSVNPELVKNKRVAIVAKNGFVSLTDPTRVGKIELEDDDAPSELRTFRVIMGLTRLPEGRWVM